MINRNKKSLALNIKNPKGLKILTDLIKGADVFIQNFRPGSLEKMGLGFDDVINTINSKIIYKNEKKRKHYVTKPNPYIMTQTTEFKFKKTADLKKSILSLIEELNLAEPGEYPESMSASRAIKSANNCDASVTSKILGGNPNSIGLKSRSGRKPPTLQYVLSGIDGFGS
mgnify:CR=1 FL=1